jgi:hypothetical protein
MTEKFYNMIRGFYNGFLKYLLFIPFYLFVIHFTYKNTIILLENPYKNHFFKFIIYWVLVLFFIITNYLFIKISVKLQWINEHRVESLDLIIRQNEIIENMLKKNSNDQATNDQKSTKE